MPEFDATLVDASTVRFGRTGIEATAGHWAKEDVDGDGDIDLILHFEVQDTGFVAGDTQGKLTGQTFDGTLFTSTDTVRVFLPGDIDGDLRGH